MKKEYADKLLDHYLPGFSQAEKNKALLFSATYNKEVREESEALKKDIQYLKEVIAHNLNEYEKAINSAEKEIQDLNNELKEAQNQIRDLNQFRASSF